jgi:hypothetical protein
MSRDKAVPCPGGFGNPPLRLTLQSAGFCTGGMFAIENGIGITDSFRRFQLNRATIAFAYQFALADLRRRGFLTLLPKSVEVQKLLRQK